jgi:Cdc6-like AAA superfamily ATPase
MIFLRIECARQGLTVYPHPFVNPCNTFMISPKDTVMADEKAKIESLQKAFINFSLRAEKYSDEMLVDTFVDSAPLLDLLSNGNSQIVYGRRGTGKTHALKYVADLVSKRGEMPVYLDLRSIGSNTSIYNDFSRSLSELVPVV